MCLLVQNSVAILTHTSSTINRTPQMGEILKGVGLLSHVKVAVRRLISLKRTFWTLRNASFAVKNSFGIDKYEEI